MAGVADHQSEDQFHAWLDTSDGRRLGKRRLRWRKDRATTDIRGHDHAGIVSRDIRYVGREVDYNLATTVRFSANGKNGFFTDRPDPSVCREVDMRIRPTRRGIVVGRSRRCNGDHFVC